MSNRHDPMSDQLRKWLSSRRTATGTPGFSEEFQRGYDTAVEEDAALATPPDDLAPHPGENHEFRTTCQRCGEPGMLHVSVITPNEVVTISDRETP